LKVLAHLKAAAQFYCGGAMAPQAQRAYVIEIALAAAFDDRPNVIGIP
jgi:hypothetical protein